MAKKVPDVKLEPATKGMQSNLSHYSASPNSWSFLENFDTDRQGVLRTRPNVYIKGVSLTTNDFQGAGAMQSIDSNGLPYERFLVKSGTECYNIQANDASYGNLTANSITFANAGDIARFDTIQGLGVFACNGNNVRFTSNGTSATDFATAGLGMPTTTDIISCGFSGRIWGATGNTAPSTFIQDRVYYSDVIPASGVANTTGSGQYIRVNTKGKFITGLVEANNVLYVFTADSVFRIYNTQSVDNTPFINIGAVRQEAIVKTFDSIYFYHFTGVYKLDGAGATKVSQDIDDFIGKMAILTEAFGATGGSDDASYLKRVFGWFDEQSVYFSVDWDPGFAGAATDKDRTYIVRFNYLFKTWSVYSLKDFRLSWAVSNFFPSDYGGLTIAASMAPITLLLGKNITSDIYLAGYYDIPPYYDGEKNSLGSGENFLGEPLGDWSFFGDVTYTPSTTSNAIRPIYSNGETQWLDFGLENHIKEINGISIASENGQGFQLMYQIDNEQEQKSDRRNPVWYEIGTLGEKYVTHFLDFKSKPFFRIKFKVSGQTLGRPVEIGNITMISVSDEGYGKN